MLRGWAGRGSPLCSWASFPLGLDLRPSCRAHLTVFLLPHQLEDGALDALLGLL